MESHSLGKVIALYLSVPNTSETVEKASLHLDTDGIIGDKHYQKSPQRSVLLTSSESYDLAIANSVNLAVGTLGENILISYNPYHLPSGSQLQIGEVVVEITQKCTMCSHLSKIDKRLPKLLENDRGIFVKVIKRGEIKKGDLLYLV